MSTSTTSTPTTSTTTSTPQLSARTADRLREAYARRDEDNSEGLYALVAALRAQGWSLATIGAPLGISREMVRLWQLKAADLDLPAVTVEAKPTRPVPKATVEAEEAAARRVARDRLEQKWLDKNLPMMLLLKPAAEALRGPSMFNPEGAAASREYTRLINETLDAGVRQSVLADALGVKQATLNRRRRLGKGKTAPSEKISAWARPDWPRTA